MTNSTDLFEQEQKNTTIILKVEKPFHTKEYIPICFPGALLQYTSRFFTSGDDYRIVHNNCYSITTIVDRL